MSSPKLKLLILERINHVCIVVIEISPKFTCEMTIFEV